MRLFLAAFLTLFPAMAWAQTCATSLRFHFVAVHDDNGSNGPQNQGGGAWGAAQLQPWITAVQTMVGTPAGLTFEYRPALDWEDVNSSVLNQGLMSGNETAAARSRAAAIVSEHPGKIVVFLRRWASFGGPATCGADNDGTFCTNGPSYAEPPNIGQTVPTGWGNGQDYVVASSAWAPLSSSSSLSGQPRLFAHEVGHFLGLYHTFPTRSSLSNADAFSWQSSWVGFCSRAGTCGPGARCVAGGCYRNFDGDLISDTAEDPGAAAWQSSCTTGCGGSTPACQQSTNTCTDFCTAATTTIGTGSFTKTYTPPLDNIMSYYDQTCSAPQRITPGQASKIAATLQHASRIRLCQQPCFPDFNGVPVGQVDQCLRYWRGREGFGPLALSVDWSGTVAAGALRPNANNSLSTDRASYENLTSMLGAAGFGSGHYSLRGNQALGIMRPGMTSVQTFHRMSSTTFNTVWGTMFNSGRALVDVSVTSSSPLELSAVWADQGHTSATYFQSSTQEIKNSSDAFYGNGIRLDRVVPFANGAGHGFIANWNFSSTLRAVFSSSAAGYQSQYNSLAALGYSIHDLEYFEGAGLVTVWEAPHNECTAGSKLHHDTDNCIASVCNADSFCCSSSWDAWCVAETTSVCGRSCP